MSTNAVWGLPVVKDLWRENDRHRPWRNWKTEPHELYLQTELDLQAWKDCANQRKIHIREGPDILRWGHSTTGNFSVKEAYYLQENYQEQPRERIWGKIWNPKFWPKVSIFLWLTIQNRILTWDNLWKRGFIGPSICPLCQQQEETMEHLFNHCNYSEIIWDMGTQVMRRSNRNRASIISTVENWDSISYQNPILDRIWQLLPGFTMWKIWKERNKRIFHSMTSPPLSTWERIMNLIRETIKSGQWSQEDLKCNPGEIHILQTWQLNLTGERQNNGVTRTNGSPCTWSPPPTGFIKLNFDGASKGNPGPTGFGAVL
jgi:hypothetical protein